MARCKRHSYNREKLQRGTLMAEQLNPSADPEVGLFIIATDDESWVRLVEMGITSMRKLIDHIGATAGSVLVSGHALAPRRSAGLCPAVLKRSLFNWCHDSGLRVYVDIEAAVACVTTQGSNPTPGYIADSRHRSAILTRLSLALDRAI